MNARHAPALGTAIGLIEYESIAAGIAAGDAMVKRSPLQVIRAGTIHPGRYVVLVGGEVADVEEAFDAAELTIAEGVWDRLFLPDPHPDLVDALTGSKGPPSGEALAIVETSSVAAVIRAADAGLKGAAVTVRELAMGDDLGGKGYVLFSGALTEVQVAAELAGSAAADALLAGRVIAQLHDEMDENLAAHARFGRRVAG